MIFLCVLHHFTPPNTSISWGIHGIFLGFRVPNSEPRALRHHRQRPGQRRRRQRRQRRGEAAGDEEPRGRREAHRSGACGARTCGGGSEDFWDLHRLLEVVHPTFIVFVG